ncbi:MAG: TIGR00725 family protein [Solirubrobacterales bacterium]
MAERRRYAAVVGPGRCDEETAALAEEVGAGLARAGFTLVTGGAFGAMGAASRGAHEAGGVVVGLLPGTDRSGGNQWSDVTLATGLGHARNLAVVASADVVVAVGGEWGTLSEIGLAGAVGRPVVLLAGWRLEHAAGMPSEVAYADTPAAAVALANTLATA